MRGSVLWPCFVGVALGTGCGSPPEPVAAPPEKAPELPEPIQYSPQLDRDPSISKMRLGDPSTKVLGRPKMADAGAGDADPPFESYEIRAKQNPKAFGEKVHSLSYNFTRGKLTEVYFQAASWPSCERLRQRATTQFGSPSKDARSGNMVNVEWLGRTARFTLRLRDGETCFGNLTQVQSTDVSE